MKRRKLPIGIQTFREMRDGRTIFLVGVEFSRQWRNIVGFEVETDQGSPADENERAMP